jgi:acetyl/propionyl-CoA carboxylase alpha subunit
MISKISVWGATREEAVGRLRVALDEARVEAPRKADGTQLGSLRTNLSFLRRLVRNETVVGGDTTTDLIAKNPDLTAPESETPTLEAALALSVHQLLNESGSLATTPPESQWLRVSRREGVLK